MCELESGSSKMVPSSSSALPWSSILSYIIPTLNSPSAHVRKIPVLPWVFMENIRLRVVIEIFLYVTCFFNLLYLNQIQKPRPGAFSVHTKIPVVEYFHWNDSGCWPNIYTSFHTLKSAMKNFWFKDVQNSHKSSSFDFKTNI